MLTLVHLRHHEPFIDLVMIMGAALLNAQTWSEGSAFLSAIP